MVSRPNKTFLPVVCLSLLVLIANLVNVQTVAATATPPVPMLNVTLDALLEIGHEVDLSEYDGLVTGGGDLSQSARAALAGTGGGLQLTIDDTSAIYGTAQFGTLSGTAYRFRHYLDPNSLSLPNYGQITLAQFRSGTNLLMTRLQYTDAGGYRLYVRFVDDNGLWRNTTSTPISNAEHYVEVLVEFASSAAARDGRVTYWVDGILAHQLTALDLYDLSRRPNHVRLGAVWVSQAGTDGTLYLDELVLYDDGRYIGPVGPGPAPGQSETAPTPPTSPWGHWSATRMTSNEPPTRRWSSWLRLQQPPSAQ